jgi:hypothetical protein
MAGFSPGLHNHEFDLHETHQDCSPCQFSQINAEVNDFSYNIFFIPAVQNYQIKLTLVYIVNLSWTLSGLSPPPNSLNFISFHSSLFIIESKTNPERLC